MKKSTKLISLLLVLVMLLSIIPMAVAADAAFTLGRTKLYDAVLEKGNAPASATLNQNLNAGVAYKDIKQSGLYMRLPRYTEVRKYTTTDYLPVQYVLPDDAVTLSNPDVISNLQFSLKAGTVTGWKGSYPCIAFEYAGAKNGSTDVTLKYYYKFDSRSGLTGWYYDIVTFKVNVSNVETTQPSKPTTKDIADFCDDRYGAVLLECSGNWYDHSVFYKNLNDAVDGYSIGEVEENDGTDGSSKTRYPWVCKVTVHVDAWIALYNEDWADECGTHYLQEGSDTDKVLTFYWDSMNKAWDYDGSDSPVDLFITHTAPTPAVTEYTVTYTDGVEDEEVFADQTYTVKEGDATPAFNGTPEREGYVFLGWGPEVAETVTGNATYTATWEEALTEVKVTSSISEGALLYLGSEFKVTATANTDAKLTFNFEANPAFKQIASDATGNSKTVWYRVVKITGNYTKINVSVTGTKGNQEPVTGTLSFGVNLRNRIHVTIKTTSGEIIATAENVKLNHKYPQWNTCPALKYDAAKQEYVMKNPWDLSSQEFVSVSFEYDGETYETKVTRDGENIFDVIRAGEKEIYVEYTIVDPIYLTIEVDGVNVAENEKYKGQKDEKMDYFQKLKEVQQNLLDENKTTLSMATYVDDQLITGKYTPLFGANKTVKIVITTNA